LSAIGSHIIKITEVLDVGRTRRLQPTLVDQLRLPKSILTLWLPVARFVQQ